MSGEARVEAEGTMAIAIEAGEDPQSLWVRVGVVYDADGGILPGPGVWIEYQEHHMAGPMSGPVLLTPQAWRRLGAGAVDGRLRKLEVLPAVAGADELRAYPGEWVAIRGGKVIAHGDSPGDAIQELRDRGLSAESVFRVPSW